MKLKSLFSKKPSPKSDDGKLAALLNKNKIDLVIDVGANTGQTGKRLRSLGYTGRIVSFEPIKSVHAELCAAAQNDESWRVMPPMGLSATASTARINITAASDMSSLREPNDVLKRSLPNAETVASEDITLETLDRVWPQIAKPGDRAFLKIDTQGYELDVLKGAAQTLPHLQGIMAELSLVPLYEGEPNYLPICRFIEDAGFVPALFITGYFSKSETRLLQMDGVFFRS